MLDERKDVAAGVAALLIFACAFITMTLVLCGGLAAIVVWMVRAIMAG